MSGVAGGNRIKKANVQQTFDDFVSKVLTAIPEFKKAVLSGSIKVGAKSDYGDIDLVALFRGDDKREVKQKIVNVVTALPDNVIVPFKSEKYKGKKFYNAGELISVLFPISGTQNENIQVDIIIALSEEEHTFKSEFLDLPAEKQGLFIGLAKVVLLEETPKLVFSKMGIKNIPSLKEGEEYEFNLSSVKLTLRKVKLENFKEVSKMDVWSSSNWDDVKKLFSNFNTKGSFNELLEDLSQKLKQNRSKNRIAGVFRSMVTVKSGEVGTPKGKAKEKALKEVAQTLSESLEDGSTVVAIYGGGFKPPHKAHFENAKILSSKADKLIIFIGQKIREGVPITALQSKQIWEIYAKYLSVPTEVHVSPVTPIKDTYDWVDANQEKVDKVLTGTTAEEKVKKFGSFLKNKEKYPKVELLELPVITTDEDNKFSATFIRQSEQALAEGSWMPEVVSPSDKQRIIEIVLPKTESFTSFFFKKS